ncbi:MAG TPA: formyltransferase family protein [Thermoanaerobaculia bacterium]|nr:formyltransferase family protein [Thermoanaerobaculia bacterium]
MVRSPRIVLAGSVSFSRVTLETLIRLGATICGTLGLDPAAARQVSDYARLDDVAAAAGIPYVGFTKINAPEIVAQLRAWSPDALFVVGLSQLVQDEILSIPHVGAIGFHPTPLPRGRGRAPVAWLTWDGDSGAATFFVLERQADSGAIFVQEPFAVRRDAYAGEVIEAVRAAIIRGIERWGPRLLAGEWNPIPQDEQRATFWGKRAPEDGLIDWSRPASEIARLVRTASRPYPGAYTFARDHRVRIWRASTVDLPFRGVVGRVLNAWPDGSLLVQTGDGLLRVEELEIVDGELSGHAWVGQKLGYDQDEEIFRLRERVRLLEKRLEQAPI